jgi:hypothetical protein
MRYKKRNFKLAVIFYRKIKREFRLQKVLTGLELRSSVHGSELFDMLRGIERLNGFEITVYLLW